LEDFTFDMTGEQALNLLASDALEQVREKHRKDFLVLVEGRVGVIQREGSDGETSAVGYFEELQKAGATGVIVGAGLSEGNNDYRKLRNAARAL
jgi:hypothetical protein